MLSKDIFVGSIYLVKISGKIQQVKILKSCTNGGWIAVNLATGRNIRLRTGARVRPFIPTK